MTDLTTDLTTDQHAGSDSAPPPPALPPTVARTGAGLGEIILMSLLLAAILTGEIAINKPKILFDGPFSLDECLTDSIVRDPDIGHSIQAVKGGVDTNPPVYHLILRGLWKATHSLFHESPRLALRAFSIVCDWLALSGVFILLRKGFSRWVALVGALAVWAHPDVIEQSANARFYAPLLFATVAMCLALQIRGKGIIRGLIVALCAIFLCTLHYFGILSLGPLVLAMLLVDEGSLLGRIMRVLPAIAGPLALLPFIPFVRSQGHGLTVKTWIDPFTFYTAREFLLAVLCTLPLLIAVAIWSIGRLWKRDDSPSTASTDRLGLRAASVPMLSMFLVPVVIVGFSATVQSALVSRYAIAAALILAPLVALLSESSSKRLLFFTFILLSMFTVVEMHGVVGRRASQLQILNDQSAELRINDPTLPYVFADRAMAAQLRNFSPDLAPSISIIDQRAPGVTLRDFRRYELEMSGKVAAFYPTPPLITPQQLATMGRFHLIADPDDMQTILLEQPLKHVSDDVYESVK